MESEEFVSSLPEEANTESEAMQEETKGEEEEQKNEQQDDVYYSEIEMKTCLKTSKYRKEQIALAKRYRNIKRRLKKQVYND